MAFSQHKEIQLGYLGRENGRWGELAPAKEDRYRPEYSAEILEKLPWSTRTVETRKS